MTLTQAQRLQLAATPLSCPIDPEWGYALPAAKTTTAVDPITRWHASQHNQQLQAESNRRWALTAPAKRLRSAASYR